MKSFNTIKDVVKRVLNFNSAPNEFALSPEQLSRLTELLDNMILIMKRVEKEKLRFSIINWQQMRSIADTACTTLEELIYVNKFACAAGYLALTPWWRSVGGNVGPGGEPVFEDKKEERALVAFIIGTADQRDYVAPTFSRDMQVRVLENQFKSILFVNNARTRHDFYTPNYKSLFPPPVRPKMVLAALRHFRYYGRVY